MKIELEEQDYTHGERWKKAVVPVSKTPIHIWGKYMRDVLDSKINPFEVEVSLQTRIESFGICYKDRRYNFWIIYPQHTKEEALAIYYYLFATTTRNEWIHL